MKLMEEKELQAITDEYEKALRIFHKKDYKRAQAAFADIIEKYKNSESFSVLEMQTRSKVYMTIADSFLNPVKPVLKSDDDVLWEGLYQMNAGHVDQALELFQKIKSPNAHLYYLLALVYFQKDDVDQALTYMEKCVKKDESYKIQLYNEPDFEPLLQNPKFLAIVE